LPRAASDPAEPRGRAGEIRITWIGHATTLIQMGGLNVLTDPVWSHRVSPVRWAGPARIEPPGLDFDALPPVDVVLISHDHYDHLDRPTVRRLVARGGSGTTWCAPRGYRKWLRRRGAENIVELDWWETTTVALGDAGVTLRALPAQHWTRRTAGGMNRRLWASWALEGADGGKLYFAGDSGYCPVFSEIGGRAGPFDASLIPIGAYEPRWFMRPHHMNPEEAVRTYLDLGGRGTFMGIHWGTFILTDEPVVEPPERARAAWADAGLRPADLWIPAFGETRVVKLAPPG
jgi:L-ascorbate metabolism protein UlaG (beta-lactamase superfamily)